MSRLPTKFLPVNVNAPSSMDVYGYVSLNFEEPIASFDTAAIHLRQKVDTIWKDIFRIRTRLIESEAV